MADETPKKLRVTQTKSAIGYNEKQKATIKALGLGRTNWSVVVSDTPTIRGMIQSVIHLVSVEEIAE